MEIKIRTERPADYEAVYALVREAFAGAEHADGNEQDLVAALRRSESFVPQLSLVAEADGALIGYILFTEAMVGDERVLALAPLAVHPAYQRQGAGTALIREGHRTAAALGYGYSIVLGSDAYYPRFGYRPAAELGIALPDGFPERFFFAAKLREDAPKLCGSVRYAREFGA